MRQQLNQTIIPVLKGIKDCENAHKYKVPYLIIMDTHIAQLEHCCKLLKDKDKKVIVHIDLIKGLKSDEYAVEYLINSLYVDGIISVKSAVIERVKKLNRLSIQRMFIIDTQSYLKSIELIKNSQPDYIEMLPGCLFKMISRVKNDLGIDVIAGGLIETVEEYQAAINAGAVAITTSKPELLKFSNKF